MLGSAYWSAVAHLATGHTIEALVREELTPSDDRLVWVRVLDLDDDIDRIHVKVRGAFGFKLWLTCHEVAAVRVLTEARR
jgi:hypothetical protein